MRSFILTVGILGSFAAVACGFHIGPTPNGAQGNASFSYSACLFGCDTTRPMMLADEEHVEVSGSIPDGVVVETSDPSIVSVKSASRMCCPNDADAGTCHTIALNDACATNETASLDVVVDAPGAGSTDLRLKKADGSVWDSNTLTVEKAASLSLACNTPKAVTLADHATCDVTWVATDASGQGLMSTKGIHLTSSDGAVAAFGSFAQTNQADIQATPELFGNVSVVAVAPGDATVTASGGGTTETLAVHVTP